MVLAFRRGNDGERKFWIKALERGEIGDSDLDHAIGLMTKHRAGGHHQPRAALWRDGGRCAGALFRLADEERWSRWWRSVSQGRTDGQAAMDGIDLSLFWLL